MKNKILIKIRLKNIVILYAVMFVVWECVWHISHS